MEIKSKKTLVGIAWPYVNGDLHVGHLAGYLLPADIFARYRRLKGDDVMMVSGSDCHGTPTTLAADKEGKTPTEIVDYYHKHDVALFKLYGLSYNLYTKTTTENHKRVVQEIFMDLLKNGYITKGTSRQYYSAKENKFLADRYVEGKCPHCGAEEQRSDQCEQCGRWLTEGELLNPYSKLTKSPVVLKDSEHYFLDFPLLVDELKAYVKTRKGIWRDWVFAEADGWLREGLEKRAITRDLDWGVDLPIDEIKKLGKDKELSSFEGKKIYVWFEAVVGYLSAPQEWASMKEANGEYPGIFNRFKGQSTDWKEWWLNKESEHFYFMGQDNLVFHTLMWPGQIIGAKRGYTLPHNVAINRFMNYEGRKFSKSRNWTIDSKAIAEKYTVDAVRFMIASNLPENKEADFTWEGFVETNNNELVANLGNLINRTLKFFETKMGGEIAGELSAIEKDTEKEIKSVFNETIELFDKAKFTEGLQRIMAFSKFGNQYFDKNEIWKVIKADPEKAQKIMLNLLNIVSTLHILISPFTPFAADKLTEMLGLEGDVLVPEVGNNKWTANIRTSFKIKGPIEILYPKLDLETVLSEKV